MRRDFFISLFLGAVMFYMIPMGSEWQWAVVPATAVIFTILTAIRSR